VIRERLGSTGEGAMKLTYDKETDTLLVILTKKVIDETEEIRPGVLADLDENGALVSLEILNASSKVDALNELLAKRSPVELEVA
jgi:uncharacterized protein YuzE